MILHNKITLRKEIISLIIVLLLITVSIFTLVNYSEERTMLSSPQFTWSVKTIDTMKSSRDLAREKNSDTAFDNEIDTQVKNIKETGANYIAIDTPYDKEFLPFLKRWVKAARKYNLKVWFRGNFSSWEGWFGYPKSMTTADHLNKIKDFILQNRDLFEDGDSFTSCPECENGVIGDPRETGKINEYRDFLINENLEVKKTFNQINKNLATNWYSMNNDVALLIMDKKTVNSLGNLIVIDHYTKDPEQIYQDAQDLANKTGAKILIGETGAPVSDITGELNEDQQANWLNSVLFNISKSKDIIGINYWVNIGGSTAIWNSDDTPREAAITLKQYFSEH